MIDPRKKWCPLIGKDCKEEGCVMYVADALVKDKPVQAACFWIESTVRGVVIERKSDEPREIIEGVRLS